MDKYFLNTDGAVISFGNFLKKKCSLMERWEYGLGKEIKRGKRTGLSRNIIKQILDIAILAQAMRISPLKKIIIPSPCNAPSKGVAGRGRYTEVKIKRKTERVSKRESWRRIF